MTEHKPAGITKKQRDELLELILTARSTANRAGREITKEAFDADGAAMDAVIEYLYTLTQ